MDEVKIKRQDLVKSLGNVGLSDWEKASDSLGFRLTSPKSGTSHVAVRTKDDIDDYSLKSLVVTIYRGTSNVVNKKIFKAFLKHGVKEDELWKALGLLK